MEKDFTNFHYAPGKKINIPVEEEERKEEKKEPVQDTCTCKECSGKTRIKDAIEKARDLMSSPEFGEKVEMTTKDYGKKVREYFKHHPEKVREYIDTNPMGWQEDSEYEIVLSDTTNTFEGVCNSLIRLHKAKDKDYGSSAEATFNEYGLVSYLVRLSDKLNRLKSLTRSGEREVNDESIEDTLQDLAAYAIMAVVSLRNKK